MFTLRYNITYETSEGRKFYCLYDMDFGEVKKQLKAFKSRYLNSNGTAKQYPNGKGFYDVKNPRIVEKYKGDYYVHSLTF